MFFSSATCKWKHERCFSICGPVKSKSWERNHEEHIAKRQLLLCQCQSCGIKRLNVYVHTHPCIHVHTLGWFFSGFLSGISSNQSHWSGHTFAKPWERGVVHTRGVRNSREACFALDFLTHAEYSLPLSLPLPLCHHSHRYSARIVCNPTTQWIKPVKKMCILTGLDFPREDYQAWVYLISIRLPHNALLYTHTYGHDARTLIQLFLSLPHCSCCLFRTLFWRMSLSGSYSSPRTELYNSCFFFFHPRSLSTSEFVISHFTL